MNPVPVVQAFTPLQLFLHADLVVKSIIVLLAVASVASWGVAFEKFWRLGRLQGLARRWLQAAGTPAQLAAFAKQADHARDPVARVHDAVLGEWRETHAQGLQRSESGRSGLKERLARVGEIAGNVEIEQLQRGLLILATIGSVAPFVGLFGTVWGIMNSFQGIAASNNTSLAVVAPGIAEALFATALGLVAAIPAVVAYNRASAALNTFAHRLTTFLGVLEVQLSRQLELGEDLSGAAPLHLADAPVTAPTTRPPERAANVAGVRLSAQGA